MTRHNHFHQHCVCKEKACSPCTIALTSLLFSEGSSASTIHRLPSGRSMLESAWRLSVSQLLVTDVTGRSSSLSPVCRDSQPWLLTQGEKEDVFIHLPVFCCLHSVTHSPCCLLRSHHYKSAVCTLSHTFPTASWDHTIINLLSALCHTLSLLPLEITPL